MTRIAIIRKDRCNPIGCGDFLCIKVCPINRTGKECIVKGEDKKPVIDEGLCTGCGICPNRCPFDAISIINLPEELTKTPIHQYGKNGFRLYNLPIPMFGKVVGIMGINGIGKSTAIKVLAGVLNPNLGEYEKKQGADYEKLIEFFKGTEAQLFFEKVKKGEIKISYKPQQVDLIPKAQKGKVKELLKKVDEKDQMEKIAEELDITKILDRDIDQVSGGELQRVAIAAAVLKRANLYIFDEPTSYLDVKQRVRVSKFIRNLADKEIAVMVVEHDLIILDYMTDLINLMYGKEGFYGIVSMHKSTRAGINVYLEGYLKEENIRFRDKQIKFNARPPTKKKIPERLVGWENIGVNLGSFNLTSAKGDLTKRNVTGVMGENGTGKTSFVKVLAGVMKPDTGEIFDGIKVSYKPQYLESESEEIVMSFLGEAVAKYENQLIRPLSIKPLLQKKLDELSGGELQRVAIARCLSQDADLYLLDEPSAYLDVEQRLIISKMIRDFMDQKGKTALIVDHDLLFLDYISEDLMVFDGVPAKKGSAKGPFTMQEGMNHFLGGLDITMRRDKESNRPRINKPGSVLDREQKNKKTLYYV